MPRRLMMGTSLCTAAILAGLAFASVAWAQPHPGGEGHGGPAGHGGGFAHGGGGRGFAGPHDEGHRGGFAGHEGGFQGHGFVAHDPGHFHGYEGFRGHEDFHGRAVGFGDARFGRGDWVRGGWHGNGPFLAYAGGRDSWDWRGAWGVGFGGPAFDIGWGGYGGWAWGGVAVGAGIGLIVAPPVYVLPPPIYVSPPPVVLGLPAIAPPPFVGAAPEIAQAAPPSTADMVAASVPPPIVVSPPPYVVAEAPPPPVIFAPANYAFAIAPPVLAFSVIGPAFYSGGYFTGGYIARGYYGAVWDRPYWQTRVRYERPGLFGRIGVGIGLGGVFGRGYERHERFYGRDEGGWHGGGGFHGGGHFEHGGGEGHHGRERG